MFRYPRHQEINYAEYVETANNPRAFYGLPSSVGFCAKCTISNQRPNSANKSTHTLNTPKTTIHFDEQGFCDACRGGELKNTVVDWDFRENELHALCDQHRRN